MKLLYILAAILAVTLAVEEKKIEYEDSQAVATIAVKRDVSRGGQDLTISAYSYPSQSNWQNVQQPTNWGNVNNNIPAASNNWANPSNNWANTGNNWANPGNNWASTGNNWGTQPSNWGNPSNLATTPSNWIYPSNVQNDEWNSAAATTAKPVSVIKNEQYYGDNGNYKYEYQIGDGTHVGEEGYIVKGINDEDNLVKKGWYSYVGADNKTYTVTYWADKTGYHAFGDHLPTPPPVPAAIQAALDKQKEAEKNKPIQNYPTQTPAPVYQTQATPVYTQPPVYRPVAPAQQNYNPTYPTQQYYPPQTYPQQQYQQQYQQQQYQQQQNQQQYQQQYQQQQYQQQQTNYAANYNV